MIKVSQTTCKPITGDCLAACIASILECDIEKLPNPYDGNWWHTWHEFLKPHGVALLSKGRSAYYWDTYWIGVVPSLNHKGRHHAVVMHSDQLVHDPNVPPAKVYEQVSYKDCVDGYTLVLSDAGLLRRSSLYA